jgi:hypothetical protein
MGARESDLSSAQVNGMHSDDFGGLNPRVHHLIVSFAFSTAFVVLLCMIFNPKWETNDDVAMSMVAHGYGIAAYGSPHLRFSNVLWGGIVRNLPSIDGLLGYSTATLLALTLSATATLYFLLRSGAGYIVGLLALAVVFARPIIFPQFTITAGLLAVGAILVLRAWNDDNSLFTLIAACCMGFLAYLIRAYEFGLVAVVGLPLLPWRKLVRSRAAWLAAAALSICIASATVIDVRAYSETEWQAFWQLNWVRAPFTDFGAVDSVLKHPDVIQRLGWSENDVRLIGAWFFADPRLADPIVLKTLLDETGTLTSANLSSAAGFTSVLLASGPQLLPLALTGFLLLVLFQRPSQLLGWTICLLAMFAVGAIGRPDVSRIYIPLFSLLVLLPCARPPLPSRWRYGAVLVVLLLGNLLNVRQLSKEGVASDKLLLQARSEKFDSPETTVVWGASFPYEYVFPVFTRKRDLPDTRIYGLGVLTLAPFTVATADELAGKGLLARLLSEAGVPLIATSYFQSLLKVYCIEHYGSPLRLSVARKTELWTVMNASCAPG